MTVQLPPADTWPHVPLRILERDIRYHGIGVQGGSSTVFNVFGYEDRVLYKKYAIPRAETDLDRLVQLQRDLDNDSAAFLRRHFAWPLTVVIAGDGAVAGVLIPKADMAYRAQLSTNRVRVRDFNYLLYEARAAQIGVEPARTRQKLILIRVLVQVLMWLEDRCLVHEDLAAHNLLWTVWPQPSVLLLDCDSIRPADSRVAEPLLTTTDWTDPRVLSGEIPRPDQASTVYTVGLLVARVFGSPYWRPSATADDSPSGRLLAGLLAVLRESTRASTPRASLAQWTAALDEAIKGTPEDTSELAPTASAAPPEPLRQGGLSYALKERLALAAGFALGAVAAIMLLTKLL
jgi:hypothetical protein